MNTNTHEWNQSDKEHLSVQSALTVYEAVGDRTEYGKRLLQFLSERLTKDFGKGFTERDLRAMRQFYETFPIRHTLRAELT